MKTVFIAGAVALLIVLAAGLPVEACWVDLSIEELVEQSDLIVIGEIKGIAATEKVEGMWVTRWDVAVHYYLKGSPDRAMVEVITPGARNKQPMISTHYHLDEWGNTVLLFLAERAGRLEPLSPQGVVALTAADSPVVQEPSGEELLLKYSIVDAKRGAEEKEALKKYLAGVPWAAAAPETGNDDGVRFSFSRYILPVAMLFLALAGLVILWRNVLKKR